MTAMTKNEQFWQKNLLCAVVVKRGKKFNVIHNRHDKQAKVIETGAHWNCGRREFRNWVKEHGGKCFKPMKTGEYIDNNGEKKTLWGIDEQ